MPDTSAARPVAPHPPLSEYYREPQRRRRWVNELFDGYDYEWINRVMSIGSGIRYWRQALVRAGVGPGMTVLDVCMGSGQVSRAARDLVGADGAVIGVDASLGLLRAARDYPRRPRRGRFRRAAPLRRDRNLVSLPGSV